MKNKIFNIKPETIFLIIGLIYGLGFLLAIPPLSVVDNEGAHFDKALYLSEGNVIPEISGHHAGYFVPQSVYNLELVFYSIRNQHGKINISDITSQLNQPLNANNKVFTDTDPAPGIPVTAVSITSIITYSPISYLASAFAISVGKLLNFSPIILMYIGRLANLFVWLFFIYMAIRISPVHKWVLLMLALMPMAIFQGASLSADSFTMALSFLVIAIFLKFSFDNNIKLIKLKDISLLFLLISLLALSKQTYFFLIFLFFLIPVNKFENFKKTLFIFVLLFITTFGLTLIWNMIVNGYYLPGYPGVSIPGQTSYILLNPLNFSNALINTLLTPNNLISIIRTFVGNFGWDPASLPGWLIALYLTMLTLTSLLDKTDIIIRYKQKLIIFITLLIVSILTCVSMYITATPVAQTSIRAIDGRYLIPISPLLFLLFYNIRIKFDIKKGFNLLITGLIILSLTIAIYLIIKKFYLF
jgi:uncharacterized membrane protein